MQTMTKRKPRVKPTRTMRVGEAVNGVRALTLTVGKQTTGYYVQRIAADFGKGFRLEKFPQDGGEVYHVNLNGQHSTCECMGYLRHGLCQDGQGCKHISACAELVRRGVI